ncbi:hypothetical protein [Streptomyces sp. NPDC093071]|uniref:hypothetical protein n=1 Tax=Streptomyces sp. NPDC093071 TaxID=3366022 RepID=UPI00380B9852
MSPRAGARGGRAGPLASTLTGGSANGRIRRGGTRRSTRPPTGAAAFFYGQNGQVPAVVLPEPTPFTYDWTHVRCVRNG